MMYDAKYSLLGPIRESNRESNREFNRSSNRGPSSRVGLQRAGGEVYLSRRGGGRVCVPG